MHKDSFIYILGALRHDPRPGLNMALLQSRSKSEPWGQAEVEAPAFDHGGRGELSRWDENAGLPEASMEPVSTYFVCHVLYCNVVQYNVM